MSTSAKSSFIENSETMGGGGIHHLFLTIFLGIKQMRKFRNIQETEGQLQKVLSHIEFQIHFFRCFKWSKITFFTIQLNVNKIFGNENSIQDVN